MEHHALLRIAEWLGERNRIDVHQHWAVVRLAGADQHGQRPAASLAGVVHLGRQPAAGAAKGVVSRLEQRCDARRLPAARCHPGSDMIGARLMTCAQTLD